MTGSDSIAEAVCGFGRYLRQEGYTPGVAEVLDALRVAKLGLIANSEAFKHALCSLFANSHDEATRFGPLFDSYWSGNVRRKHAVRHSAVQSAGRQTLEVLLQNHQAGETDESSDNAQGASITDRLVQVDFAQVRESDQEALAALADRLFRRLSRRLSRTRKAARQGNELDLRRTIRLSIARGGEPVDLAFLARKLQRPRVTALLDVSASMDKYASFLLRFMHALGRKHARVHSFVFSTRLRCITRPLRQVRRPAELSGLARESQAWRSGTRIGACLEEFMRKHAQQAISRSTLVLVLSDGLDTGDPGQMAMQVRRIRQRSRKVLWLSPLAGMEDYEPITRGLKEALPHIDAFLPAHNLSSLLQLEAHLHHA